MTWREAKRFLVLLTACGALIGACFAASGFSLVIFFILLEVGALSAAFYLVIRDGEQREVVRFDGDRLLIETGRRKLERCTEFNRYWTRVELLESGNRCHPAKLLVSSGRRALELGRFLTETERADFAKTLSDALHTNHPARPFDVNDSRPESPAYGGSARVCRNQNPVI